ncbi:ornithine--oxo-acid transaminase [Beijerinckia indica]|uniref:ornithine aminotransferase n=1 Tax=Beijerinckia indica subsp. indica (strain ATCC 9039 / DSM 1715 / NCIMB 8712) TaxID=395963 RepID=B2IK08_BEII9|nr:ornithine--oxo-acid transaminase [Beijerinckia indica]ACB96383.1 ornithine aminotransferase [Beijerinckia indica subsp. indica ATCC 9039]
MRHDFIDQEERFGAHNYAPLPVVLSHGQGAFLFDCDGRRYLDMMSAYSAASFGHLHPRLVGALKRQLERLDLVSRAYHTDTLGPFCEDLARLTGLDACLPMNTGAEAVETAIKAARRYGYDRLSIPEDQAEIIVAAGNFHGRTTTIIGFSSDAATRRGFGPFAPGFVLVPFGDAGALEAAVGPRTAAVLIEPIQGEAGIILPPPGYLAALRRLCDRHGILLIFDEVQSGFGRTGRTFAFEHEGAKPDGLILGKALGGGLLPVSAFAAKRSLMDVFDPGSHGSTFGGNPLAMAVAREAMHVLQEEHLVERSEKLGGVLLDALRAIDHPAVLAVRGKGLWAGVDLDPALADAKKVCLKMMERGVLTKETHATTIRFAPPLVITEADLLEAVGIFRAVLESLSLPTAVSTLSFAK